MTNLKTKEIKLKIKSLSLSNKPGKDVELNEKVFGIDPRADIMARVVRWQLAKRRLGNHSVQTRSEVKMTTAKMYKQKGTGKARHDLVPYHSLEGVEWPMGQWFTLTLIV